MFFIYVSSTINVSVLAGQWGQLHDSIPNGQSQSIIAALNTHQWRDIVNNTVKLKNPRIIRLADATAADVDAISFTAKMHDPDFQIIGTVTDENAATLSRIQTESQKESFNAMIDIIRDDMLAAIDQVGVSDRISWKGSKSVTFKMPSGNAGTAAQKLVQERSEFVKAQLAAQCDLNSMVSLVTTG